VDLFKRRNESARNKWRQPIILARLSNGLPLCESDQQIWTQFVQDKAEAELVASMAEILVVHVPVEEKVLISVVRAILLPVRTPFPAPRLMAPSAVFLSSLDLSDSLYSQEADVHPPSAVVTEQEPVATSTLRSCLERHFCCSPDRSGLHSQVPTSEIAFPCAPGIELLRSDDSIIRDATDTTTTNDPSCGGAGESLADEKTLETTAKLTQRLGQQSLCAEFAPAVKAARGKTIPIGLAGSLVTPPVQRRHTFSANEDKAPLTYEQPPWRVAAKPVLRRTTGLLTGLAGAGKRISPAVEAGER
jgi:hypothetical protein